MELEKIYSDIATHMVKGLMIHDNLANYYDFLGLKGYKRCHEYHYFKENMAYRSLCRYYINHHNKLIEEQEFDNPDVIPQSWYQYTRQDVDTSIKRNAVKNGLTMWVDWERDTKELYEKMYKELIEIDEIASAMKIKELICDVDDELKKAERYELNKKATDYNISDIISEQDKKHHKYEKKMKDMGVHLC